MTGAEALQDSVFAPGGTKLHIHRFCTTFTMERLILCYGFFQLLLQRSHARPTCDLFFDCRKPRAPKRVLRSRGIAGEAKVMLPAYRRSRTAVWQGGAFAAHSGKQPIIIDLWLTVLRRHIYDLRPQPKAGPFPAQARDLRWARLFTLHKPYFLCYGVYYQAFLMRSGLSPLCL